MNAEERARVEALFDLAVALPSVDRSRWLEGLATREDPQVVARLRRLLAAHARPGGLLDRGVARVDLPPSERPTPPRPVGPYRLLRELGRGGMSVVYLAERADGQYRRRVAIKFLRGELDTEELHARLAAERQILASLDHPNIARLLDGGVTDEGRPYLVMEYVEGVPITEHVRSRGLDVEARLRLFLEVTRAVEHAHARLVIHRDLKPSNILVTPQGRVRLLDFGIAKVLDAAALGFEGGGPAPTRTGARLFTPEYASPEQLRGEVASTANDVWALGILLHELLAGERPFRLEGCSLAEGERRILEGEPPRPSRLVGDPGEARRIRGDLDRIVAMALRKDAWRRYPSVERLTEDVERHLEGLPVRAQPDRVGYRLGKLVRRRRVESVAVALAILAVAGGAAGAFWQAAEAREERDRASREAVRSEAVAAYLLDLFQVADPWEVPADRLTARELLARGTQRLESLPSDPLLRARVLLALGKSYVQLGDLRSAHPLLAEALALREAALGPLDPLIAQARLARADALRREGHLQDAEALVLRVLLELGGEPAPESVAEGARETALRAEALDLLGFVHTAMGRLDDAGAAFGAELSLLRDARPGAAEVGHSLVNLAAIRRRQARFPEAEALLREALAHRVEHLGSEHPLVAVAQARLAGLLSQHMDRSEEAEDLFRQALDLQARVLGTDHPARIEALGGLAEIRERRGELEGSEDLWRESVRVHEGGLGPTHPATLGAHEGLAAFLGRTGRMEAADTLFRTALATRTEVLGPDHPGRAGALVGHATLLLAMGRPAEAGAALAEARRIREQVFGADHPLVALILVEEAEVARFEGDGARARALLAEGLALLEAFHPPGHPEVEAVRGRLAGGAGSPGQGGEEG